MALEAARLRSDTFSLDPTPEGDKVYDLPLGDDLAAVLRERMLALAPHLWIDDPIREDWGTVLWVKVEREQYYINVQWLPDKSVENRWGITFTERRGFWSSLLGHRRQSVPPGLLQELVAQVLNADPSTFREVEWMSYDEWEERI